MSQPQQQHRQQQQNQQEQQQFEHQGPQHLPFRLLKTDNFHLPISSGSPQSRLSHLLQTQGTTTVRSALTTPPNSAHPTFGTPFQLTEPALLAPDPAMSDPLDPIHLQSQSQGLVDLSRRRPRGPPSQLQPHQPHQPRQIPLHHQSLPHSPPPTATSLSFPSISQAEGISSNAATEGQPPVTYMASLIAHQLLQVGASMFGRQADANCVLKVGNDRYFVHVQMLAVSARAGHHLSPCCFVFIPPYCAYVKSSFNSPCPHY
ncbi:MAG: hypothetical protein JOS17DRAFT_300901 [Linnemannia elongata]|nr:MAG: hypothetical protein JOS17DRAFT_300901 [Linnemannia elongata]